MKKRDKGSMMLEVLVSLMILMIASMMVMTSTIAVNKSKVRREMNEKLDRVSYCIMNEIKYNYSYKEVNESIATWKLEGINIKSRGFKYTDDILGKLIETNLFELDNGNDITLAIISEENEKKILKMKISINVSTGGGLVSVERNFNKSWWMES